MLTLPLSHERGMVQRGLCSHCVCTLEYWLCDSLKSIAIDTMHSPVSIGLQFTTFTYAFYADSNV